MASLFQRFLNAISSKKVKEVNIDPESLRKHHILQAQQNKIAELQAHVNKFQIEEVKQQKREEQKEEDSEVRLLLNEQKQELEKKQYPRYFSLMAFANKIINNKKYKDINFTSFDGSTSLGKFGDIGFSQDGDVVLLDENKEVILKTPSPKDAIWSIGALNSDLEAKRIPLCVNQEGKYVENIIANWKPAQVIPMNGKFQYSHASKKELYKYLAELGEQISDLHKQVEERDEELIGLNNQNNELKVALKMHKAGSEISKKELSLAEGEVSEITNSFRGLSHELAKVRETNILLEENIDKLEKQVAKWRDEAENEGTKKQFDRVLEVFQNVRRTIARDEPTKEVRYVNSPQNISPSPNK